MNRRPSIIRPKVGDTLAKVVPAAGGGLLPVTNTVVLDTKVGGDCARESYAGGSWGSAFVAAGANYTDWVDNLTPANGTGGGLIFRDVPVPKDATIVSATITVQAQADAYDDMTMDIWGELDPDPDDFYTTNTMAGRAKTTATVFWNATSTGFHVDTSVDVTSIVQELVNQAGWVAGNKFCFIAEPTGTGNNTMRFENNRSISVVDSAEHAQLPHLEITYTVAGDVLTATGGTTSTPGDGYKYHDFTTSGSFTISQADAPQDIEVLMVGGGGGGGTGGGAAGQVQVASLRAVVGTYTVTVGAGGATAVSGGGPFPYATASKVTGPGDVELVALPGQGGGYFNDTFNYGHTFWHNGGDDSGGGPAQNYGDGNDGGASWNGSGGGAGHGGAGGSPGAINNGGAGGASVTIWGYELAGGGGGGANLTGVVGAGGGTVGGVGQNSSTAAVAPTANTGSGGGGGYTGGGGSAGTAGAAGRVVIRYPV